MYSCRSLIKTFIFVSILIPSIVFADPIYYPGATLTPTCSPADPDCAVSTSTLPALIPATFPSFIYASSTYYFASNPLNYISRGDLSVLSPIIYSSSTGVFSIAQASSSASGYLSFTDWSTFNSKQNAIANIATSTGAPGQLAVFDSINGIRSFATGTPGTFLRASTTPSGFDWAAVTEGTVTSVDTAATSGGITAVWTATTTAPRLTIGLSAGYIIPFTASTTNWNNTYNTVAASSSNWTSAYNIVNASSTNWTTAYNIVSASSSNWESLYNNVLSRLSIATSTTGTGWYVSTSTNSLTINIPTASAGASGVLSSIDWATFNNKQSTIINPVTGTGTVGQLAVFGSSTGLVSLATGTPGTFLRASTTPSGFDWVAAGGTGTVTGTSAIGVVPGRLTYWVSSTEVGSIATGTEGMFLRASSTSATGFDWALASSSGVSQWITNGSNIYYNIVGNVGIGTTSPGARLDIYGTAGTADIFGISSSSNARLFTIKSSGNAIIGDYNTGTINLSTATSVKQSLLSVDNNQLSQLEGGMYFGRTGIKENQWSLNNYGNTWAATGSSQRWRGIAMSSDGKIQTAVAYGEKIYISTDYGNTWTAKESNREWYGIAMSSDGKIQTAIAYVLGKIYISTDYGNTWTAKESNRSWSSIAMSSDGKIQTATVSGSDSIYISTDYGNTWTAKGSNNNWYGIAMSSDGKIQTAVAYGEKIYISTDYGNTWTVKEYIGSWSSIAMSSDGKIQTAVGYGEQINISTDYGNTWTTTGPSKSWSSIAMSSDGKIQTAVANGEQIYISTDYGNAWAAKQSSRDWSGIAMSSDGKIQTATVNTLGLGQIYISNADSYIQGNVGIGTTTPTSALSVIGTSTTQGLRISSLASNFLAVDASGNVYATTTSGGGGAGTVTSISVISANGVSASITSTTTTPALTFTLGAITPTSVNGLTLFASTTNGFTIAGGASSKTLTVANTIILSGTDASVLNIGTGGTLGTAAYVATTTFATAAQGILATNALPATSFNDTNTTAKLISNFVSGAGVITTADSIITAINKLDGNIANKAPTANPTFTGTTTITGNLVPSANITYNLGESTTSNAWANVYSDNVWGRNGFFATTSMDNLTVGYDAMVWEDLNVGGDNNLGRVIIKGTGSGLRLFNINDPGAPGYFLTVNGSGVVQNTFDASDERLKNIQGSFDKGLTDIMKINPINYKWKPESGYTTTDVYSGFSAQNMQLAIPEAVGIDDSTGYLYLNQKAIMAAIVNSVKQIGSFINKIESGIAYLKNIFIENLTVGSDVSPAGITMYDRTTKRPYCVSVNNGVMSNEPGECSTNIPVVNNTASAGSSIDDTNVSDSIASTSTSSENASTTIVSEEVISNQATTTEVTTPVEVFLAPESDAEPIVELTSAPETPVESAPVVSEEVIPEVTISTE